MSKRAATILKQRMELMKPLWEDYNTLKGKYDAASTDAERQSICTEMNVVVEKMNNLKMPQHK